MLALGSATAVTVAQAPTHQTSPFPFGDLINDMQELIKSQFDMPTRWSFSWTCRQYHEAEAGHDFDCFAFADKCAELGYVTLLQYSFERGGPRDYETLAVAVRHGKGPILEPILELDFFPKESIPDRRKDLIGRGGLLAKLSEAVKVGCFQIFAFFYDEIYSYDKKYLFSYACAAINGGNVDLVMVLLERMAQLERMENVVTPDSYNFSRAVENLVLAAAARGDLEAIQRIRQLEIVRWPSTFIKAVFLKGVNNGHIHIVTWCLELDPALPLDFATLLFTIFNKGHIELLDYADRNGKITTVDLLNQFVPESETFPHIRSLKWLHQRNGLSSAPVHESYRLPPWANSDDMIWLTEQGYQFTITRVFQEHLSFHDGIKLIAWIIDHGIQPTDDDILMAAKHCRLDVLNQLWEAGTGHLAPNDKMIAELVYDSTGMISIRRVVRFRLKPLLRTIQWLLAHGYTYCSDSHVFDSFVNELMKEQPKLFCDQFEAIDALKMPLSDDTRKRVDIFLSRKP